MEAAGAPAEAPEALGINTGVWGFDITGMDPDVLPGDNFYRYANGGWLEETEIPPDQSTWSTFAAVDEGSQHQVRWLLEKGAREGSETGRFYKSFMEEQKIETLGVSPLRPSLARVTQIKNHSDFAAMVGASMRGFGKAPFSLDVGADPKNPEMNVARLGQGGLGLPSRDYYLQPRFVATRAAYRGHIGKVLALAGWPDGAGVAARVLALEENIAEVSWEREKLRDPLVAYNKMTVAELPAKAPGFDWPAFMRAAGPIPEVATLVVSAFNQTAGNGVVGIARVVGDAEISTLKSWAAYHIISSAADYLPRAFVEARFQFYGQTLGGQRELKPRWKRGVAAANSMMADAVGREYVALYFPEASKEKLDVLTGLLQRAFAKRLQDLSWMTAPTKQKASAKLESFTFEIGYPKHFRNFTGLTVDEGDAFGNVERATAFAWDFDVKKLGRPIDHDYWDMPPQLVNAYFDINENKCVFPAAILQPPFFNPQGDMAVNFGAIGAIIGHEMTHGFDDRGRQYDARGRLSDWWTPADSQEFKKRARALGEQFWNFTDGLPAGMHIAPALTMGENIADLGGLAIAHDAYRLWLRNHTYEPQEPMLAPERDGHEGDRRFFAGWEQVWRAKYTEGALQRRLASDPHSPGEARGNIPPRNMDAWYSAFEVRRGDALFLEEAKRVQIW